MRAHTCQAGSSGVIAALHAVFIGKRGQADLAASGACYVASGRVCA